MSKAEHWPIVLLIGFAGLQGGWTLLYGGDEWMRSLGANGLQIAGGVLGMCLSWYASRLRTDQSRRFWRLLSAGLFFYVISSFEFLYEQFTEHRVTYSAFSYFCWLLAYLFFLVALLGKAREINAGVAKGAYIFNIVVFMVTAASVSIHFIINPILTFSDDSLLVNMLSALYPLASLSIFLITLILYYSLLQLGRLVRSMRFVIWGMLLQSAGDSGYAYLARTGAHRPGDPIDLIWLLALLLIGLGGYYALRGTETSRPDRREAKVRDNYFPYASIVGLIAIVIVTNNWDFNVLSLGLLLLFLLVGGRQLHTMRSMDKLMDEYRHLAYHDPLTGLKNRLRFKQDLEQALGRTIERAGLLLIDLDRFKAINDTLGHQAGDDILVQTAGRLIRSIGAQAPIYRLGGDEFVIVLDEAAESQCAAAAETILSYFRGPFRVGDSEIIVTPSIGISIFPDNGDTGDDLLKYADSAMYLAKESGKNSFRFYNTELHTIMARKMMLENELRRAIGRHQLSLRYQPKVELRTGRIIGMEALLRWEHPELGPIPPVEFIPIAEESGQIVAIGEWVLQRACAQNKKWQQAGYAPLCVSVNVSVRQFQHREFLGTVRRILQLTGLDPAYLELEITESIMQNVKESTEVLHGLRAMGIRASIDDFGTGYSSLYLMPRLPIDTIKIDKSFIDDIDNRYQLAMLKTIIDLGLSQGLGVVAEGIESTEQQQVLIANGCPVGQGYLYSKPVDAQAFERLLERPACED
ncbi:putative bifunctional diguanylate cyclase/phosphodiesterase [Cohnella sp. 56]|uniref:putative bifunctional diguanylate cyclase/phosphodiesterase n=1 Tax=Cohnella sp. 56 TaxID=3113722 RepID=UPI0030E9D9D4